MTLYSLILACLLSMTATTAFTVLPSAVVSNSCAPWTAVPMAKYNTMDEILALFPDDKPVLVNFYDGATEGDIKADIFRAKELLKDRATLVSIKRQDYPALAKLWDADEKSPAMILFRDGQPVTRLYEETHYLEIVARIGQFCKSS